MIRIISTCLFVSLLCTTFIIAQEKSLADAKVLAFEAVEVSLYPPKGIENFKLQWISYLDSINQTGALTNKKLYSDYVFKVIISVQGFSVTKNDAVPDSILSCFLKKQKRWTIGIHSGRPAISLLKMKVPKEIFQGWEKSRLLLIADLIEREDFYINIECLSK